MSEANTKFATARLKAARRWPYAAQAILATIPIEKSEVPTVAADKYWRLYFNPDHVLSAEIDELVGAILFEVSHLIRSHAKRFRNLLGFDPDKVDPRPDCIEQQRKTWEEAASLELVDDFDAERLTLSKDIKRAKDHNLPDSLLAEAYFERLYKDQHPGGEGQQGGGESGSSAADGCKRSWDEGFDENKPSDGKSDENGNGQSDGQGNGDGQPKQQPNDVPGLSEGEGDLISRQVAAKVAEHAKRQGRVPAGMRRWADDLIAPKLDYRKIIERRVRNAIQVIRGNLDYSYRKPARRSFNPRVIMPSMISRQIACTVVIDASGSMSNKNLGEAVSIVGKLLQALPKRDAIKVMVADAKVHTCERVFKKEQIELVGGGGTQMDVAIQQAGEDKPRPNLVICITDGYTPWPKEPVSHIDYVTIVVSNGDDSHIPKWLNPICVPPEELERKK